MEHPRDEATEAVLGDIIAAGSDVVLSFLNDTDGQEGQSEEAGYGDRTMEEEGHDYDGSGDRMPVEEGHLDDSSGDRVLVEGHRDYGSGDRTESGQVYIY